MPELEQLHAPLVADTNLQNPARMLEDLCQLSPSWVPGGAEAHVDHRPES